MQTTTTLTLCVYLAVNWWATYPAEPIPGLVVAHGAYHLLQEGAIEAGAEQPPQHVRIAPEARHQRVRRSAGLEDGDLHRAANASSSSTAPGSTITLTSRPARIST